MKALLFALLLPVDSIDLNCSPAAVALVPGGTAISCVQPATHCVYLRAQLHSWVCPLNSEAAELLYRQFCQDPKVLPYSRIDNRSVTPTGGGDCVITP